MELILAPILFAIQFAGWLVTTILGFIFNAMFRRNKVATNGDENDSADSLRPENPWQVFFCSLFGSVVLASIGAAISYYVFETNSAALKGFVVVVVAGLFASLSAATGEPPAM